MSITSQTSDSLYSKESFSIDLPPVDDLIASLKVWLTFSNPTMYKKKRTPDFSNDN